MLNTNIAIILGTIVAVLSVSSHVLAGKAGKSASNDNTRHMSQSSFENTYRYQKTKKDKPAYKYRNTHQFTHNFERKIITVNNPKR